MDTPSSSSRNSVEDVGTAPVRKRQISLRELFLCTAYFAFSSALALRFGLGLFVMMNGLFLTWLSFRGYLWWVQTNRIRPKLYGTGWLIFAVSFGLPAFTVKGCGNGSPTTYYGWEAAFSTAAAVEGLGRDMAGIARESQRRTAKDVWQLALSCVMIVLWNLPNLLMLASPFILYRQQRGKGRLLSALICCAAVCSWTWGITGGDDLKVGYYVWSTGITVISVARPPGWRSLLSMATVGLAWMLIGSVGITP
jgi:hypothetical protein